MNNKKITPMFWFDRSKGTSTDIANFYKNILKDVELGKSNILKNTPSGETEILNVSIFNTNFVFMSSGPDFKLNPSVSLVLNCKTKEEIENVFENIKEEGKVLMPLGEYPFAKNFAWVEDKYGLSWQLTQVDNFENKIVTFLHFANKNKGKAEEAANFYINIFENSKIKDISIVKDENIDNRENDPSAKVVNYELDGLSLCNMENDYESPFNFDEAFSFIINCKNQEEIDYFWDKLIEGGGSESMCGWCKDKFGVSWQVAPENMDRLMSQNEENFKIMMTQKKIIISEYLD